MSQVTLYQASTFGDLLPEDVQTIHETIAKDCNESQFRLFMSIAKVMDANPLRGEIHPSVFSGKLSVQYGIDYYIRKAKETDSYRGYDVQLVHENDTYRVQRKRADDGRYYDEIVHEWEGNRGKVIRGYAIAYKEGFQPFLVEMDVEEVEHWKASAIGMQKTMWTKQFNDMFKKHMVKRALKAAFNELNEDTDMGGSDATPEPYERKDITAEVNAASKTSEQPQNSGEGQSEEKTQKDPALEQKWKVIGEKLNALGHTTKTAHAKYLNENMRVGIQAATAADLDNLIKQLDMEIAELAAGDDDLE
ncbi:RecT family recombinase [Paenibacillus harenae]|uniref:Recombination protein RecT n=1 Tax=Paenibacillus harenae TaxID=306543 RepID=A0ABT9U3U4_PAEHA|nr:RecT family recombinase [Paenibacillus harenae]MDQ0114319.1 recombination protein RecT [Paenibacillus harenae]